jgi:uncharacterized membrane protein
MSLFKTKDPDTNISERERLASLASGASLVAFGLTKRNPAGFALAALGGGLLWRGATGHCEVYHALGINTSGSRATIPYELGIRIDHSIVVDKPAAELYRFWRNFENLPKFMDHLESVTIVDGRRSHWISQGPAGTSVEWDAEVINEIENELIGWKSLEGSDVDNAGSVHFEPVPDGRGTRVTVHLQYNPPAGSLGAAVAKMFGQDPKKQVSSDMKRFKEFMETGRIDSKQKLTARGKGEGKKPLWDRDAVNQASEESFPASDPPSWTPETTR